jgi:hypothetical protein
MSLLKLFQKAAQSESRSKSTTTTSVEDEIDASHLEDPQPDPTSESPGKLGDQVLLLLCMSIIKIKYQSRIDHE